MSKRKGLYKGYILNYSEKENYIIDSEIGRGSSCIVYDGIYVDSLNLPHQVRIKECYPINLELQRSADGELIASNGHAFDKEKARFKNTYQDNVTFRFSEGYTNSSSNATYILECNNTLYTIIDYQEGITYDKVLETSLPDLIKTILSIAKLIKKYHDNNYLYLDLKPSNVLILPESREQVVLFDFDSLRCINAENNTKLISYSDGFSAPEQCKGQLDKIGKHSDIYALGALLFYKLFNRLPTIADTLTSATFDFDDVNKIDINAYSLIIQERLTAFFRKTLATSIHARWKEMDLAIGVLEQILQATTVSTIMKNFLVEYITRKPCFNLKIAEQELDNLHCETEWQYMKTMNEMVSQKVSEILQPQSEMLIEYHEQYRKIYIEIGNFFSELIKEGVLEREIKNMVIKSRDSHLQFIEKNIDLKEVALIKIQVQQEKPRKQLYVDLRKKDTLWTTLFGKGETRYCLSLESRNYVISQIERITRYNEQLIHKNYVDNIKILFDLVNSRIKDSDGQKLACVDSLYSEAIQMIYSNNENLYEKGLSLLFDSYKVGNVNQSIAEINKHLPLSDGEFLGIAGYKILFLQRGEDRNTGGRILFKSKDIRGIEKLLYNKRTIHTEYSVKCNVLEIDPYIFILIEDDFCLQLYCYDSEKELFEKKSEFSIPPIYGDLFLEKMSENKIIWGITDYFDKSGTVELYYSIDC